jgi:hypothetical protein
MEGLAHEGIATTVQIICSEKGKATLKLFVAQAT